MTRFVVIAGDQTGHNAPLFRLTRLLMDHNKANTVKLFGPLKIRGEVSSLLLGLELEDYLQDHVGSPHILTMHEAALEVVKQLDCLPSQQLLGESLTHQSVLFSLFLLNQTPILQRIQEFQPDAVVCDSGYPWGFFIAQVLNLPFISSCSSALVPSEMGDFYLRDVEYVQKCTAKLQTEFGIDYDPANAYRNYSGCTIAWTLPELDPHRNQMDDDDDNNNTTVHYFGAAMELDELDRPVQDELALEAEAFHGRTIYISMGTVVGQKSWTPSLDLFFQTVMEAFGGKDDLLVILSVGKRYDMDDKIPSNKIPTNFRVRRQVAQRELLRVVDVFVTHGGNNSIHEGLFLATPLLVVPVFGDQHQNATMVVTNGLGLDIPSPDAPNCSQNLDYVSRDVLVSKWNEILLRHDEIKSQCQRMQKKLVDRGKWVEANGERLIHAFCKKRAK